jgi:hypothetical protein
VVNARFRIGVWWTDQLCELKFENLPAGKEIQLRLNGGDCTQGFRNAQGQNMGSKNYSFTWIEGAEPVSTIEVTF